MSVLIKGLEMPKSCAECPVNMNICKRGYKYLLAHMELYDQRADDCPITTVPPHGDLIDKQYAYQNTMVMGEHMRKIILKQIDLLPTVIPAEEGE